MTIREAVDMIENRYPEVVDLVRAERPYKIPRGFLPWPTLSALIAAGLVNYRDRYRDVASQLHFIRSALWFVQAAPIYCVSNDLLRAFEQTDILEQPALLQGLEPALPTYILLFPQNAIRTPSGSPLDWALVHLADAEHPERSRGSAHGFSVPYVSHEHRRNFHWSGCDRDEVVWFAGCGLDTDGSVIITGEQVGADPTSQEESRFLRNMRSLVLQCTLALTYRPDLLSEEPQARTGKRSGGSAKRNPPVLHPRWLGRTYRSPRGSSGGVAHRSPVVHWRKGHWRSQAYGPGWQEHRPIWIEPTLIGR